MKIDFLSLFILTLNKIQFINTLSCRYMLSCIKCVITTMILKFSKSFYLKCKREEIDFSLGKFSEIQC